MQDIKKLGLKSGNLYATLMKKFKGDTMEKFQQMIKEQSPIEKLELVISPSADMFGLYDKVERNELIGVMRKAGLKHVCVNYPTANEITRDRETLSKILKITGCEDFNRFPNAPENEKQREIIRLILEASSKNKVKERVLKYKAIVGKTIELTEDLLDSGISVSIGNINKKRKMQDILGIVGEEKLNRYSYFNTLNHNSKEVHDYCKKNGLLYVSNSRFIRDIDSQIAHGKEVTKAIEYVNEDGSGAHHGIGKYNQPNADGKKMWVNAVVEKPVITEDITNSPVKVNKFFKKAVSTDCVVLVSSDHAPNLYLDKSKKTVMDRLTMFDSYLSKINRAHYDTAKEK